MLDTRTPAEVYRDLVRSLRAKVDFRPELDTDGNPKPVYRGPRGEAGVQPIYHGQKADKWAEQTS